MIAVELIQIDRMTNKEFEVQICFCPKRAPPNLHVDLCPQVWTLDTSATLTKDVVPVGIGFSNGERSTEVGLGVAEGRNGMDLLFQNAIHLTTVVYYLSLFLYVYIYIHTYTHSVSTGVNVSWPYSLNYWESHQLLSLVSA